ncbi:hypothetical protein BE18_39040 [Sorangium cellulosum]|uniref:Calcineurin-like phosphoesterase domain-containing protein n=1 Tax=Sorangium cellulosum TaxID=56 RepID=A0A150R8Y6_SORCE|nr:hypothetical protein BE18_39040 [Sorangium cellulosum]
MKPSLLRALGHPTASTHAHPRAAEQVLPPEDAPRGQGSPRSDRPPAKDYAFDASADADIGRVEPEHVAWLEERLRDDPDPILAEARSLWDARLTEGELRGALDRARALLEPSTTAEPLLRAAAAPVQAFGMPDGDGLLRAAAVPMQPDGLLRAAAVPMQPDGVLRAAAASVRAVGMPDGFGFLGYDSTWLPILPMEEKFETVADGAMYALAFVASKAANSLKPKAPFRYHDASKERSFVYDMPVAKTSLALLADFGNGLPHSRYIAKHIRRLAPDHLLYLGDVYYAGTSAEFAAFVAPEFEDMLARTNVMMLSSNHEMFSKAYPYFSYLDYRMGLGAPQVQQGSYFCLRFGDAFQIIGLETDYFGHMTYADARLRSWLSQILQDGRQRGCINVLLSANEPFQYGSMELTRMYEHLKPYLPAVDLWMWGNTHYCGLFDMTPELPVSSCIGHGGYPYRLSEYGLDKDLYAAPCPATPLFLESQSRYHGYKLRPEIGNNGFCMLHLDPGQGPSTRRLRLEYIDWRSRLRYRAELGRQQDGRVAVLHGAEEV